MNPDSNLATSFVVVATFPPRPHSGENAPLRKKAYTFSPESTLKQVMNAIWDEPPSVYFYRPPITIELLPDERTIPERPSPFEDVNGATETAAVRK